MTANDNRIDARDWSLLAGLSVLWGGSFLFNGVVLKELPPLTVVLLRVALAAMILLPVLRAYQIRFPVGLSGWKPFFAIALLNNVLPFSLIVIGQTYIPSGLASILNATTPLFTVMVMAAAGDEKLHARRVVGVLTGLIGVIVLHGQDVHGQGVHGQDAHGQDPGFQSGEGVGILLCLAAAFSYGLSALYARRKLSNSPPLATATFQLLASALMMTIVAAVFERPWQLPMPGVTTWLAMIGLSALSTALAYIVFFQVLRRSGSTNVMLVTLLIPVTAILLGYLVLGESISLREIIGAVVIGSALLLMDGRVLKLIPGFSIPKTTP
ncbi:MAG TPA: DMT family transporter [Bradyrhizobium sp.]|jgi:drug/metabolite transporter (DMT)-like permease|nr:DMT family transporter [Bradyrhizobium sp.]